MKHELCWKNYELLTGSLIGSIPFRLRGVSCQTESWKYRRWNLFFGAQKPISEIGTLLKICHSVGSYISLLNYWFSEAWIEHETSAGFRYANFSRIELSFASSGHRKQIQSTNPVIIMPSQQQQQQQIYIFQEDNYRVKKMEWLFSIDIPRNNNNQS